MLQRIFLQFAFGKLPQRTLQQLQMDAKAVQRIAQFMGHASRQLRNGLHFLRLHLPFVGLHRLRIVVENQRRVWLTAFTGGGAALRHRHDREIKIAVFRIENFHFTT